mgnify:CR=1 FL=1
MLALGIGLSVFGSVLGSIAENQKRAAAHAAENNAIYHRNHLKAHAKKNADYTSLRAFTNNHLSAGREYTGLQNVYKEKMKSLAFSNQGIIEQLYKGNTPQGTGKSAQRALVARKGAVGRKLAINRATAESAKMNFNDKVESLYGWGGKLDKAQTAAWRGGNPVQYESYLDPGATAARMQNPLISALPGLGSDLQTAGDINNPFSGLFG